MNKNKNLLVLLPILLIVACSHGADGVSVNDSASVDNTSLTSSLSVSNSSSLNNESQSKSNYSSSNNTSVSNHSSKSSSTSSSTHTHNVLPVWYTNSEQHWKECSGCSEKFESGKHTFGEAIQVNAPTCMEKGKIKYVCSVCSYEKFEDKDELSHNFESGWHSNSETHWHACLNKGCNEKSEESSHTWTDNPNDNSSLICLVCEKTKLKNHEHNFDETTIVVKDNGTNVVYGYGCSCGEVHEIDFSSYSIKVGNNEETAAQYNPYNLKSYLSIGTLSFDPTNERFVLELSGNNSDKNIFIDSSNVDNPSDLEIKINQDDTSLGGISFVGDGNLIFTGNSLKIAKGNIVSNAKTTLVENEVTLSNDNKQGTGITLTNGVLKIAENGSLNISGYDQAIALGGDSSNLVSLDQEGDINISNCSKGILGVIAESSFEFKGNTSIITDGYPVRANNGLHVKVIDGVHTWKSTTSSTVLSVLNLTVGEEGHNPQLNIISNGGTAISDQSNEAQNRYEFVSGITNVTCENENSDGSTIGFKVTGEDRIYIRKDATVNFDNFPISIKGFTNVTVLNIYGYLRLTNVKKSGIQEVTINVGNEDQTESGTLYVEASGIGTNEDTVNCLFINTYERINFYSGTALLVGSGIANCQSGLYFDGCDMTKFRINEGFKLGCADMKYGINNHGSAFFGNYDRIANLADYHYFNLEDCAWYCGDVKKGFTKHLTAESFKEVFGDLYNK